MDLSKVAEAYVDRLVENNGKAKMLLLDNDTTAILSLASTQTHLLKNDVFLYDKIDNPARQRMRSLECLCFLRPTSASIANLIDELRAPRYGQYTLVFTNQVRKSQLERLAQSDDHEACVRVQEMFLDWLKINRDLFSCAVPNIWSTSKWSVFDSIGLERSVEGVFAAIGSLKLGSPPIRVDANSKLSREFASRVSQLLSQQSATLPHSQKSSVILILDRLNDPVTPLISHWTYQAMVDEVLGITNNIVDLSDAPDVREENKQIVLAQDQDAFFAESMYLNFGDLGAAVREYVQHYQTRSERTTQFEGVAEMKRFVEELPEFRKEGGNVTKHVTLVSELTRQVKEQHLLAVSELEQSLACSENHSNDLQQIQEFIASPQLSAYGKYRLVALYGLRYRKHPHCATEPLLESLRVSEGDFGLYRAVSNLLRVYSGKATFPQEDLFNQGSIFMRAQQGLKGLKGVENVYTQHKPLLELILSQLCRGRLPREKYPYVANAPRIDESEPAQALVFVVGGVTFEEARVVAEFNKQGKGPKIILGGTGMVNPTKFLDALKEVNWE